MCTPNSSLQAADQAHGCLRGRSPAFWITRRYCLYLFLWLWAFLSALIAWKTRQMEFFTMKVCFSPSCISALSILMEQNWIIPGMSSPQPWCLWHLAFELFLWDSVLTVSVVTVNQAGFLPPTSWLRSSTCVLNKLRERLSRGSSSLISITCWWPGDDFF